MMANGLAHTYRGLIAGLVACGLLLMSAPSVLAQKKPETRAARSSAVNAVVKTEGATVYTEPHFDAGNLSNLKRGQKVRISRKTYGEYAKFHKIRVGKRIGYISDIDVAIRGAKRASEKPGKSARQASVGEKSKEQERKEELKRSERRRTLPMYFTRYIGLLFGQVAFKEGIFGVESNENLLAYGLKLTGPDVIIEGPILDFNLALHYGAPSYYDGLSVTKPTGFILWTDLLIVIPLVNGMDSMVYVEAGPLLRTSSFRVTNSGRPMSLTDVNLGASFVLGGAFRIEKVALRLEAKSMLEKHTYHSYQFVLQTDF